MLVPKRGKPLVVDLPLPQTNAKSLTQDSYVDLTSHPYAGLTVTGHLEAEDATRQVGVSNAISFQLPARVFTDPVARALVEQRQNLAVADAAGRKVVVIALDAFIIDPDKFYPGKADIVRDIKGAHDLLQKAKTDADIAKVEQVLWETALKLERGGLLSAAEELRKLALQLAQAMAAGAPQDVIDELLRRYNEAMQRYVQALQANPDLAQQGPAAFAARRQDAGHERCADPAQDDPGPDPRRRPPAGGAAAGAAAVDAGKHAHDPGQGR